MSLDVDWPCYGPDLALRIETTQGRLQLAHAVLLNHARFALTKGNIQATLWRNGAMATGLDLDRRDGSLSLGVPVAVCEGDLIEVRLQLVGNLSLPWCTKTLLRRSAFLVVPPREERMAFDGTVSTMPVPALDLAFGWDAGDRLKVGVAVTDADGAQQDLVIYTRTLCTDTTRQTSSNVRLSHDEPQTHLSAFTRNEVEVACELELRFPSARSGSRQETRTRIVLLKLDEIHGYPERFPSSGVMIRQDRPQGSGAARLSEA